MAPGGHSLVRKNESTTVITDVTGTESTKESELFKIKPSQNIYPVM